MSEDHRVTVGQHHGDFVGFDNFAIQAAIDRVAEHGGLVEIGPGRYTMHDSLHLRSFVTVRGAGTATVLVKAPMVASALSADLGYGHADVSLAEPDRFAVGLGVLITDDGAPGFYSTVATLTWRNGDRFGLDACLNHDYARARNATVRSLHPVVSGCQIQDAGLHDLAIDGAGDLNEPLNGCRGGGVFLLRTTRVLVSGVTVSAFNGDGISFQQTRDTVIEDCLCEGNTGLGLHPGSGSVRPVMRAITCRRNGSDGIFYCLRVSWSLCEDCLIEDNGGHGISIGGRDTDHLIRGNTIRHNGRHGLYFRPADRVMAGHRVRFEDNALEHNCAAEGAGEIALEAAVEEVQLLNNSVTAIARDDRPAVCLVVGPEARRIVAHGNSLLPAGAIELRGPAEAVSTDAPSSLLDVGPEAAPDDADRHLLPGLPR